MHRETPALRQLAALVGRGGSEMARDACAQGRTQWETLISRGEQLAKLELRQLSFSPDQSNIETVTFGKK